MQLTIQTLAKIAGKPANDNMRSIVASLDRFGKDAGLDRPHRLAHFLAQLAHESGGFRYDREVWGPTAAQARYDTRKDLGNTPERDGDGEKNAGRGPIQLTGGANIRAFHAWCIAKGYRPPDFPSNPDLINTDPWEGLSAIWYWSVGNPTGKSLNSYADNNDIETITKRINGGLNGFTDRLAWYTKAALVLCGYGPTAIKLFQVDAQRAGNLPAGANQVDGDAGPKTRAALHLTLVSLDIRATAAGNTTAGPVVETIETAVPVAPQGADRTLMQRITGGVGILAPVAGSFAGFDRTGQLLMLGIGVAAVVVLLWRGELIAARVKSVLKSFA